MHLNDLGCKHSCRPPLWPDEELHGVRLRAEPSGDHAAVGRRPRQPAPAGHRQDVPERERLCHVGEVRPHVRHPHPFPRLPLHRHPHHRLRAALRHHRHAQVGRRGKLSDDKIRIRMKMTKINHPVKQL